tara:strand:- start:3229 stop:4458 length:1230 start_codon:yes stop_codon:yes gene_type:complete
MEYRDYQLEIINKASRTIAEHKFVYLAMEVRTGKTLTALGIAEQQNCKRVLFLTKKKAIRSIEKDYEMLNPLYNLLVINYESIHKIPDVKWDMVIVDEAHSLGAFPKPNKRAKQVRDIIKVNRCLVCLMSGTPTPESYSQMYHQVFGIPTNPFKEHKTFYKFANQYVDKRQKKINSMYINDYTRGYETIIDKMNPFTYRFSQSDAGFKVDTKEHILNVEMDEVTYYLCRKLKRNRVVEGDEEVILADTPVKLMMKLHQLYSGTIKFESGKGMVIDTSKAQFIYKKFAGKKIAIFYKFKQELKAIKEVYGDDICTELSLFKETNKSIALQIVSGREGISLKEADALVYYNIDFSATSYWQSRDRMTTIDRLESDVYWVFAKDGIENEIYKAVCKKKDYTVRHFKKDLLTL